MSSKLGYGNGNKWWRSSGDGTIQIFIFLNY